MKEFFELGGDNLLLEVSKITDEIRDKYKKMNIVFYGKYNILIKKQGGG